MVEQPARMVRGHIERQLGRDLGKPANIMDGIG
jgi:hypothetical protein